ncbi:inovirus Gp2 family protein [Pseudoalteromonas shioyasakiensis]|uniref:inovirus Gp2 family protein n=1 Tax=Pseudoalteromonas shioyasakiensis TaxID=1190813 RepID=UPI0022B20DFA|nr:inovirus Gp2 family protein [Pseudoalteromonas shioyasakiensis]MCZ4252168.1 inovirus Gp2 family protein [Pseudoalteromonas shioyasakiensis]
MNKLYTYNPAYQKRIELVLDHAISKYPRLNVFRFDLRLPDYYQDTDTPSPLATNLISKFFASLKVKLSYDLLKRRRSGKRVHNSELYYVWAREVGDKKNKEHYHISIFINKDRFHSLGNYDCNSDSLASLIIQAWASALGIPEYEAQSLVHFPDNASNWVNRNSEKCPSQRDISVSRLDYLAKDQTKVYGEGKRNFGTSQVPKKLY